MSIALKIDRNDEFTREALGLLQDYIGLPGRHDCILPGLGIRKRRREFKFYGNSVLELELLITCMLQYSL